MSKVVHIAPQETGPGGDIMARLEKVEDSFLAGLQQIRGIKAELRKRSEVSPGLEKLLDAKAVADLFGESEKWVYQQVKKGKMPSIRVGKYYKFVPSQLQKWLEGKASA